MTPLVLRSGLAGSSRFILSYSYPSLRFSGSYFEDLGVWRHRAVDGPTCREGMYTDSTCWFVSYILQSIINFAKAHYAATHPGLSSSPPPKAPSIGRGVGMAIGLFLITITASVCQHQFFWRSMTTGLLARAALISSVYKRGVRLTGKARVALPNSALVNHISTDVSPLYHNVHNIPML